MGASSTWTGERLVPSVMNETAMEHLARYAFCTELVKGKVVLDAACGEGYGTNILSQTAKSAIGIDIDGGVISHARENYTTANIKFLQSSVLQTTLPSHEFDVIVSFETLEHVEEHDQLMTEFKRLLKPGGFLILSTPNIEEYTIKRNRINPFHKKELTVQGFENLIKKYFVNHQLFGQQTITASVIKTLSSTTLEPIAYKKGSFNSIEDAFIGTSPMFLLAVASDGFLPDNQTLFFSGSSLFDELKQAYESTWSYKIGRAITSPVRIVKSLFS